MVNKVKADFEKGKDLIIGVIAGCGQERMVAYREGNS